MKYFILLILSVFGLKTCDQKQHPLTLISAKSQNWAAGTPQGGTGTNFYFQVVLNTDVNIVAGKFWNEGFVYDLGISRTKGNLNSNKTQPDFGNGDTITLRCIKYSNNPPLEEKTPQKSTALGLISYQMNDKIYYLEVDSISKMPHQARP